MIGKGLFLGGVVLLAGCSTANKQPVEPQEWQPDLSQCVEAPAHLDVYSLPPPESGTTRISFRESARCLIQDELPEPVVLYHLESVEAPAEVDVSFHTGPSTVLSAQVELLDDSFSTIEVLPFESFNQRGHSFTRRIFLNESDADIRYLLIRPDREVYGREMNRISGQRTTMVYVTPLVAGSFSDGVERSQTLLFRDDGTYSLNPVRGWKNSTMEPGEESDEP